MAGSTDAEKKAWNKRKKNYLKMRDEYGCKVNKPWFVSINAIGEGRITW